MSIATFGDLKTAVANYLNRSDLTSYIPDFIRLGERRIFYGGDNPYPTPPVRIPAMQNRATGSLSGVPSSSISFPTGFLEVIRIRASDGNKYWTLDYAPPNRLTEGENDTDVPSHYTFLNNEIEISGSGSASYTLDYYKAFTSLTNDTDTNWLLTNAPDAYLFAALTESSSFINDERLPAWFGFYKSIVSSLNRSAAGKAGGSLYIKAA